MKVSLMYYPDDAASEVISIIQTCEDLGFYACYLTDSSLRRDLWVLLGAAAKTNIANPARSERGAYPVS